MAWAISSGRPRRWSGTPEANVALRSSEPAKRLSISVSIGPGALPNASFEAVFPLTLHIFTHVAGLWPLCHPSAASKKLLEQKEFAHLNLDFKTEMTRFLMQFLAKISPKPARFVPKHPPSSKTLRTLNASQALDR